MVYFGNSPDTGFEIQFRGLRVVMERVGKIVKLESSFQHKISQLNDFPCMK